MRMSAQDCGGETAEGDGKEPEKRKPAGWIKVFDCRLDNSNHVTTQGVLAKDGVPWLE